VAILWVIGTFVMHDVSAADDDGASTQPEPSTRVLAGLDKRLPALTFKEIGLSDGLDFLGDIAGLNMIVDWRSLNTVGIRRDMPVSLQVHDRRLSCVIKLTLTQVSSPTSRPAFVGVADAVVVSTENGLRRIQHDVQAMLDMVTKEKDSPLGKQLSLNYDLRNHSPSVVEGPFSGFIDLVSNISGTTINVNWNALDKVGIKKDTKVSIQANDLSLGQMLVFVLDTKSDRDASFQIGWDGKAINITATK